MIAGFMHVCMLNYWKEIVEDQMEVMKSSGLLDVVDFVKCGVLGRESFSPLHPKISVGYESPDVTEYEYPTLQMLWRFCKEHTGAKVFYVHTKGVTGRRAEVRDFQPPTGRRKENVDQWRRFLDYIILYQYKKCLVELEHGASACGPNWRHAKYKYFAGNFWWARADYVASLKKPVKPDLPNGPRARAPAEFWIGTGIGTAAQMWKSRANHYSGAYPPEMYTGKSQKVTYFKIN